MRGLSEENGSWKIICIWRRKGSRSASRRSAVRSVPAKWMAPATGAWRPQIIRATVDLPEPDSPTRPKTSPSRMSNDTSFTASR